MRRRRVGEERADVRDERRVDVALVELDVVGLPLVRPAREALGRGRAGLVVAQRRGAGARREREQGDVARDAQPPHPAQHGRRRRLFSNHSRGSVAASVERDGLATAERWPRRRRRRRWAACFSTARCGARACRARARSSVYADRARARESAQRTGLALARARARTSFAARSAVRAADGVDDRPRGAPTPLVPRRHAAQHRLLQLRGRRDVPRRVRLARA